MVMYSNYTDNRLETYKKVHEAKNVVYEISWVSYCLNIYEGISKIRL